MQLTKHTHACVTLDKEGSRLLLDPGTFTANAAELAASAGTILITHEHLTTSTRRRSRWRLRPDPS